jgi:chromosome condensin MukBEF MukE localization factor
LLQEATFSLHYLFSLKKSISQTGKHKGKFQKENAKFKFSAEVSDGSKLQSHHPRFLRNLAKEPGTGKCEMFVHFQKERMYKWGKLNDL